MLRVSDCVADCVWPVYDSRPIAAHRKSDQRRDDFCASGLRKRVQGSPIKNAVSNQWWQNSRSYVQEASHMLDD